MLSMILRKMASNKWLNACLLAGSLIAIALIASIPLYTDGVLQRMLTRDLENSQETTGRFPGRYFIKTGFYYYADDDTNIKMLAPYDEAVKEELIPELGVPTLVSTTQLTMDFLQVQPERQREENPKDKYMKLEALEGFEDHAAVLHGRMMSSTDADGVVEVLVTEQVMQEFDLLLDEVYVAKDMRSFLKEPLRVRVVGVFAMKDPTDIFWFQGLWAYDETLVMDYGLFHRKFTDPPSRALTGAQWSFALDYHRITLQNLQRVVQTLEAQVRLLESYRVTFDLPMRSTLKLYFEREKQLLATLWFLQIPVLLMLAFYVYMVSQLIIDNERNEIAVLKSRGAGSAQIFLIYFLESLVMAAAALLAGPLLGLLICRMLGASNGFMEFIQRTALPIRLTGKVYLYASAGAVLLVATMLIPAFLASRTTIVLHKQRRSRAAGAPFWKKAFLDVLLLAVSGYGFYSYKTQQKVLAITGVKAGELPLDPLLFLISTLFILGLGLVILRLYPYLVRFVFWVGRRIWTPDLYATFIHVGRSLGQEQFLMIFLILTLSIGILNAKAARTVNRNLEEKVRYSTGADVTILEEWPSDQPAGSGAPEDPMAAGGGPAAAPVYREPDFSRFENLNGVELATKVFRREGAFASVVGGKTAQVYLMGIVPHEFGKVSWFRADLLPYHWHQYLNLLAQSPKALLVSSSFAAKYQLKPGDTVDVTWANQSFLDGVIYGIVDFWPTYNPHAKGSGEHLVVANFNYIQAKMALEPYGVWLKKKPGATSEGIYRDIEKLQMTVEALSDAGQEIIKQKNDPMLQGTNGALTLGFILTMVISTIGFLIYWIISIQSRVLQFGIFRAMGLSRGRLTAMLLWEQLLISGTAILLGLTIGSVTSDLFVPLLQLTTSAAQQVPPYRVVASAEDYAKLYAFIAVMLVAAFAVLGAIISRIRISQAIKLGEE